MSQNENGGVTHKIVMDDGIGFDDKLAVKDGAVSTIEERPRMILNPNKEVVDKIIYRIFKCGGKCPCQPQDSPLDTRCPCSEFTSRGVCHCHLFVPCPTEDKE